MSQFNPANVLPFVHSGHAEGVQDEWDYYAEKALAKLRIKRGSEQWLRVFGGSDEEEDDDINSDGLEEWSSNFNIDVANNGEDAWIEFRHEEDRPVLELILKMSWKDFSSDM